MDWKSLEGKKIFVLLNSGSKYTGEVLEVDTSANVVFITLLEQKYNQKITFPNSQIEQLEEKKRDYPNEQ